MSERQVKRLKKNEVDEIRAERAERDKDNIRMSSCFNVDQANLHQVLKS